MSRQQINQWHEKFQENQQVWLNWLKTHLQDCRDFETAWEAFTAEQQQTQGLPYIASTMPKASETRRSIS